MAGRRMTPKGEMSGSGMGPAVAHLPPAMKAMFEPRGPLLYKAPIVKRKMPQLSGLSVFVTAFETTPPPPRVIMETPKERQERIRKATMKANDEAVDLLALDYDPHNNPHATADAYKTLFISRMSYDTTEKKLRREFEQYGPIKTIRVVTDLKDKPRGYAFVEFERETDMRNAYKRADGRKIDGRRVLVDVERGRTVRGWRPRRLGGGLGGTRRSLEDEKREREKREKEKEKKREKDRLEREKYKEEKRRRDDDDKKDRKKRDRKDKDKDRKRDRKRSRSPRDRDRKDRKRDRKDDKDRKDRKRDRKDRDKDRKDRKDRDDGDRKFRENEVEQEAGPEGQVGDVSNVNGENDMASTAPADAQGAPAPTGDEPPAPTDAMATDGQAPQMAGDT